MIPQNGLARVGELIAQPALLPPAISEAGILVSSASSGTVTLFLTSAKRHANPHGTMHAGILATLLDTAMGYATETTLEPDQGFTTIEFKMNFIRPVPLGGVRLTATGLVRSRGKTLAVVEAMAFDPADRLMASALGTCMILQTDNRV